MKPTLVLFSDFGIDSGLVASMHGVCAQVDPTLSVYDATHLLPAFSVRAASCCLNYTVPYWPAGTVFVCVVDPGVGTARRACAARLNTGSIVVTPDNGTLTMLDEFIGVAEVRAIDETVNRFHGPEEVSVFHGRDLFSYCGARLAAGVISFEEVGPAYPAAELVRHPIRRAELGPGFARGVIESHDPFGTAETNFRNRDFARTGFTLGEVLHVRISRGEETVFAGEVPYQRTFGCVPVGKPVLFPDLAFFVSLGINQGSFFARHGLREDEVYEIELRRS